MWLSPKGGKMGSKMNIFGKINLSEEYLVWTLNKFYIIEPNKMKFSK